MFEWYRKLTGLHLHGGGSLKDAVIKVGKLPWWRSKTLYLVGSFYVDESIVIPPNITIHIQNPEGVAMPDSKNTINADRVTGTALLRNKINRPVVEIPFLRPGSNKTNYLNMHLVDFLRAAGQIKNQITTDHTAAAKCKTMMDMALFSKQG